MSTYGTVGSSNKTNVIESKGKSSETKPLLKDYQSKGYGDIYPEKYATCWSNVFFSWLNPIMELGNKQPLEFEHLYQLNPENRATSVSEQFQKEWDNQCLKSKPSVVRALFKAFGFRFYLAGLLKLIHDSLLFVGPMVIKAVIAFLNEPEAPMSQGMFYVGVMLISSIIQSFSLRQYFYYCYLTGMKFRSAIVTKVYKKSLVLSSASRQKTTVGEITNLMSIDAQRLQDLTPYLHGIWYGMFQIIVSCYLLWQQLGPACLGGIAVIILVIPITGLLSKLMRGLQQQLMKVKDERVKICYEVLSGMKVIKLQAWENSFIERVMDYRSDELKKLRTYLLARAGSGTVFNSVSALVAVASFLMYILLGNTLDVGTALTSLALFNILRFPLFMLPQVINNVVEATVSFKRLNEFFVAEERTPVSEGDLQEVGVKANYATFCWDEAKSQNNSSTGNFSGVEDLTLNLKSGQLCAVVGHVGSGKSTLINGLLGDARCCVGSVNLRGKVAYVSQEPFIQNATVRDNICFNLPYDKARYDKAIKVSALEHDLKVLPAGDSTEIGEKGINLSGGQRVRVSIARAVYQDADIYLLDDPLSAVDGHVGMHIFDQCILGALGSKLRIFVTNAVSFLPKCDYIVVLDNGKVTEKGTYGELVKLQGTLCTLLKANSENRPTSPKKDAVKDESVAAIEEESTEDYDEDSTPIRIEKKRTVSKIIEEKAELMTVEERSTGNVPWSVYQEWIRAGGGYPVFSLAVISYIISQGVNVASTVWLSIWSENEKKSDSDDPSYFFLYVYIALNMGYTVTVFFRLLLILFGGLKASRHLFEWLLSSILRSPMSFFDTTPLGRIVNRMSKDIYVVDEQIPATWNMYLGTLISVLSTIFTIIYVTPLFIVILIPIIYLYYRWQLYFIKTSRELQRLDSISRSPVYALLTETIDGLSTIHAYRVEEPFTIRSFNLLDRNQRAFFLNFSINCWLALRLEFSGTMISTGAVLFAVLGHGSFNKYYAGLAGVSLSYAFNVTQSLNWSVRMASQLQTQMVAVERIKEYSEKEPEAELEVSGSSALSVDWPQEGKLEFKHVVLRYRPGLPKVLRGLTFTVLPKEKVGIVGRTGAGKSSLMVAIMRIVEIDSGNIFLDNVDIGKIGLHQLRKRISIIPQDPVLFSGSVRSNLDPFDEYSDAEIWRSLKRARLSSAVSSLEDIITERGLNYSVGERQLFCIARALLQKNRIILMDEATASIDIQTDQMIQQSIREEFTDSTCLTIAHRINTIMDSTRVLVMDDGVVAEYDKPDVLLTKKDGIFRSLVEKWEEGLDE